MIRRILRHRRLKCAAIPQPQGTTMFQEEFGVDVDDGVNRREQRLRHFAKVAMVRR
jgi:hypothetical protein